MDASCEAGGYSGIGGLCVDSSGEVVGFFSKKAPAELLLLIQGSDKETAILELEVVAISFAIHPWQSLMPAKRVIVITDNEPHQVQRHQGIFSEPFCGLASGRCFQSRRCLSLPSVA